MKGERQVSSFGELVKKAGLSQTDLKEKLEEKGIYKSQMTVHRWCTGANSCRDLFVVKEIAEILGQPLKKVVKSFS